MHTAQLMQVMQPLLAKFAKTITCSIRRPLNVNPMIVNKGNILTAFRKPAAAVHQAAHPVLILIRVLLASIKTKPL